MTEHKPHEPDTKVSFEERKHADDIQLGRAELDLKRRDSRFWRSPTVLAVLALLGTFGVAMMQRRSEQSVEQKRSQQELLLEDKRAQSNLILEAIKTGDPAKASANLRFLIDIGLLDDPGHKIVDHLNKKGAPVLPASSGSFPPLTQNAIRVLDRNTTLGIQGALIVRRRDNFNCPLTDANGESECELRSGERVDINAAGYQPQKDFRLSSHSASLTPKSNGHE